MVHVSKPDFLVDDLEHLTNKFNNSFLEPLQEFQSLGGMDQTVDEI